VAVGELIEVPKSYYKRFRAVLFRACDGGRFAFAISMIGAATNPLPIVQRIYRRLCIA
jgi:hypothetical protein